MEQPANDLGNPTPARALAAVLLAVVAATVFLEWRSPLASALRRQTPWAAWVGVQEARQEPRLYLALYQPALRVLNLVYLPEMEEPMGKRPPKRRPVAARTAELEATLGELAGGALPRPFPLFSFAATTAHEEPPLALKAAVVDHLLGIKFWRLFPSLLARAQEGLPAFDRAAAALEIHRLNARAIHPAWMPDAASAEEFWASRLLAGPAPALDRPIVAEVLNASSEKGVASQATKVLRLKGIDVIYFGNTAPRRQTAVYDRTGRPEAAAQVAAMLECGSAEALTQVDLKRLVDVTIVLAEDCFHGTR